MLCMHLTNWVSSAQFTWIVPIKVAVTLRCDHFRLPSLSIQTNVLGTIIARQQTHTQSDPCVFKAFVPHSTHTITTVNNRRSTSILLCLVFTYGQFSCFSARALNQHTRTNTHVVANARCLNNNAEHLCLSLVCVSYLSLAIVVAQFCNCIEQYSNYKIFNS